MKKFIFFILFVFVFIPSAYSEDHPDKPVITKKLTDSIYIIQGKGGNIGVSVGEDGVLMIDDDYPEMLDQVKAALGELSDSDIKFLINTHWHGDHTGNNAEFGQEAVIVAHKNIRRRLSTQQVVEIFSKVVEPTPEEGLPVITFEESVTIHFNGEQIDVVHYPHSHTDGDGVIFFRGSNVVHLGDLFFNGFYPFVDVGSGGNFENLKNNIGSLLKVIPEDAIIIPGHGPIADLDDLKAYHIMLDEVTTIVQGHIKAGKSLEEIQQASLPEHIISEWGDGFLSTDVWLSIIYNSYTK